MLYFSDEILKVFLYFKEIICANLLMPRKYNLNYLTFREFKKVINIFL